MLARLAPAVSLFGLFLACAATPAAAGNTANDVTPVAAPNAAAPAIAHQAGSMEAQAIIQRQLDAFKKNDADSAFSLASPGLKETYSNPHNFMDSVRSGETPFFKRRMVEYHDFVTSGDDAAQSVVLVDDDSSVWTVVYKLSRQPDGSWLIDGVVLVKSDALDA
jgi:hypothetical protein